MQPLNLPFCDLQPSILNVLHFSSRTLRPTFYFPYFISILVSFFLLPSMCILSPSFSPSSQLHSPDVATAAVLRFRTVQIQLTPYGWLRDPLSSWHTGMFRKMNRSSNTETFMVLTLKKIVAGNVLWNYSDSTWVKWAETFSIINSNVIYTKRSNKRNKA